MTLFELYKYIGKDDEQVKVKSGVLDNTGVGLTTSYDDSISHYVDMSEVEIVDNIRVAKYMSFRNGKFVKYPTTDEVFVDPHKEYKDIFTEFITMQFFKSPESLFNFLEAICTTFELAFSAYRSKYNIKDAELFFIYKGGNVLRIIANDFLKEFPAHANKLLISKYEKYFGRSDCDFSVYIKPEINDYEQVFKDITLISYILQVKLRKQFMAEPSKYFDFYKYNVEYQKQLLNECFKKIVKSTALSDPSNEIYYGKIPQSISFNDDSYIGRRDVGIQRDQSEADSLAGKQGDICLYALNNDESALYISVNETLDFFGTKRGTRVKFNLARTKIAFNIQFTDTMSNIGGELIDVSIPHRLEYKLINLFNQGVEHGISRYTLHFGEKTLVFSSYSLDHLIIDLEIILFVERLPWEDPKYTKRIYRIFYLYIVDLFVKITSHHERGVFIEKLYLILKNPESHIDNTVVNLRALANEYENLKFASFATYLANIAIDRSDSEMIEYRKMCQVIMDNCENAFALFDNLKKYCKIESTVDYEDLYNNDFKSLIGGKPTPNDNYQQETHSN